MSPWAFAMWTLATVTSEDTLCWLFPVQALVSSRCWAEPWVAGWRQLYEHDQLFRYAFQALKVGSGSEDAG